MIIVGLGIEVESRDISFYFIIIKFFVEFEVGYYNEVDDWGLKRYNKFELWKERLYFLFLVLYFFS